MAVPDLDFLSAPGEECCGALSPPVPDDLIVPQDGYAVWRQAFGTDPSPPSTRPGQLRDARARHEDWDEYDDLPERA